MNTGPQLIMNPRKFALLASFLVAGLGVCVLLGWAFNIATLKSVFPGLVAMKANTAIGMLLSGLALALLSREQVSEQTRLLAATLAVVVMAAGALTLLEYFFGWDLRIDQVLFQEAAGAVATLSPGRMAPLSALCFLFGGNALFVASQRRAWRWPILSALGAALGIKSTAH